MANYCNTFAFSNRLQCGGPALKHLTPSLDPHPTHGQVIHQLAFDLVMRAEHRLFSAIRASSPLRITYIDPGLKMREKLSKESARVVVFNDLFIEIRRWKSHTEAAGGKRRLLSGATSHPVSSQTQSSLCLPDQRPFCVGQPYRHEGLVGTVAWGLK